jgi:transposase
LSQSCLTTLFPSNSRVSACDCLAHRFGNAADRPDRVRQYPSDMTDAEWHVVRDAMPVPAWLEERGGQPEATATGRCWTRSAMSRTTRSSGERCPPAFRRGTGCYAFFRRWRDKGLAREFHDRLRQRARRAEGRDVEPTAAIIDSQSVKGAASVPATSRGYDGGKKINGRRRHIITDSIGLLLTVLVTAADVTDRQAARVMLPRLREKFRKITLIWADGGYTGRLVTWAREKLQLTLEIVKRSDDMSGFVVLPRRWCVERTLGWLMRSLRLVRDFETLPASSETFVYFSMAMLMSRRIAIPAPAAEQLAGTSPCHGGGPTLP